MNNPDLKERMEAHDVAFNAMFSKIADTMELYSCTHALRRNGHDNAADALFRISIQTWLEGFDALRDVACLKPGSNEAPDDFSILDLLDELGLLDDDEDNDFSLEYEDDNEDGDDEEPHLVC